MFCIYMFKMKCESMCLHSLQIPKKNKLERNMHRIDTRQIINHLMVCNKRNVKHETICWIGLVDIVKGLSNTKNRVMKVLLFLWNQFE